MRGEYRSRSPERGAMDRDSAAGRSRDLQGRSDDDYYQYQSRQDYSMSPPRHDFHGDSRERNIRYQRDIHQEYGSGGGIGGGGGGGGGGAGGRESYYDGYRDGDDDDDAHFERDAGSRSSRYRDWEDDLRGDMYDDDYHRGRCDESRRSDGYSSSRGHGRHHYGSRSPPPPGRLRSRSRSRSPRRDAGRPSDTVILEGLPFNIPTNELREGILNSSIAVEFPSVDVRISSSRGHCRAFVQFEQMDHAAAFVKQHFPLLLVHLPHSTDEVPDGKFDAYIHYARPRDDADTRSSTGSNWVCPACDFSNYASRNKCKVCGSSQSAPSAQQGLNGDADASDVPSQILVVYPLPPFVNEDMLAGDIKRLELERPDPAKDTSRGAPKLKSTAPTGDASRFGARPGSLHRVFLMRSPKTEESVKYGFAEFWTIEDAVAAMAKFRMSRSFTVAACAVAVSHIHMGVFIPEERDVEPAIERLSFNPLFNPALRVKYRDPRAYPSQKVITSEPPVGDGTSPNNQDDEQNDAKKSKKRKADGSLGAAAKKSVNMAGHMALWQRKHDEIHREAASAKKGDSASPPGDGNQGPVGSGPIIKSDPKAPIRISLSGSTLASSAPKIEAPVAVVIDETSAGPVQAQSSDEGAAATPVSYVDRERLMCLICMRKYKSTDEVNIHEKSRNHKTATENDELVKAALPRLAARDKRLQKQAGEGESAGDAGTAPQYRDRAKERREAYNQPNKPKPAGDKSKAEHAKKDEAKASSASASASASASGSVSTAAPAPAPAQSKGAGMLAKMGWTGSGLGANGEGRTDVIVTHAYQEGVGLGAEGGNLGDASDLADKKTRNSYAEYLTTVQDKARERYSRMS